MDAVEKIKIKAALANGQKLISGSEFAEYRLKQRYLAYRCNQECAEKAKLWVSLSHSELIIHMDNETPNYRKVPSSLEIINEKDDSLRHALIFSFWKYFEKDASEFYPENINEYQPIWDGYNQWRREQIS